MSAPAPGSAADLLAELDGLGIQLEADGEHLRFRPREKVTADLAGRMKMHKPELVARLKAHKAELLAVLRPAHESAPALPAPTGDPPAKLTKAVCRCGSTTWRDVPIHGGQSVRRDCGRCGRFLEFPIWYGNDNLQDEN
jgi:hypothetical protein